MANKTIYGCVNRATGAITFADEACDGSDYSGCIVRTGVHTGQVAITISEYNCSDTYYGCVNRTTGQFQIEVPSDCCCDSCVYTEDDCEHYPAGETPAICVVQFKDIQEVSGCASWPSNPNRTFCVPCSSATDCNWRLTDDGGWDVVIMHHPFLCQNTDIFCQLTGSSLVAPGDSCFYAMLTLGITSGTFNNQLVDGTCKEEQVFECSNPGKYRSPRLEGYGGTCLLIDPCA